MKVPHIFESLTNPERNHFDTSEHSARTPSFSRVLKRTIVSVKRNICIHETTNSEIETLIEHVGNLEERWQDSDLELYRAFGVIASEPALKDELKSYLSRNKAKLRYGNRLKTLNKVLRNTSDHCIH